MYKLPVFAPAPVSPVAIACQSTTTVNVQKQYSNTEIYHITDDRHSAPSSIHI